MSAAPSHIRPATRGDLPEVVDLLNACDVAEVGEPCLLYTSDAADE